MNNIYEFKSLKVKRLAPSAATMRQLYLLSGNNCAYNFQGEKCRQSLVSLDTGAFIGNICHIEAASPGGERFNINMTEDDRRKPENLILLCSNCHIKTNDINIYTVDILKEMKAKHEKKFSMELVLQEMSNSLKNYANAGFIQAKNLNNLFRSVEDDNWKRNPDEFRKTVEYANNSFENYAALTPPAKELFKRCLERSRYIDDREYLGVYPSEIQHTVIGYSQHLRPLFDELTRAKLMTLGEDMENTNVLYFSSEMSGEYNCDIWAYLKEFCQKESHDIASFLNNLDFSLLDS